ncbi:MAG: TonB-dependent receptor, partial [Pseudomonadota bacterium]
GQTGADILIARGEDDPEELEEFGELGVFAYLAADAVFKGFEFEAAADLGQVGSTLFSADVVVDYVDAELDEADAAGNDELPRIPPLGIIAGLQADLPAGSLRAEVEYAAEADETVSFELPTDAFTLFNLYADWNITDKLTLSVAGLNLSDEEARLHTSFIKDQVPLPGRNVRFAVRYQF